MKRFIVALLLLCAHSIAGMDLDSAEKYVQNAEKIKEMMIERPKYVVMDSALKLGISLRESDIARIESGQSCFYGMVLTAVLKNNNKIVTTVSGYGISRYACLNKDQK